MNKKDSFTAANAMPYKIFHDIKLIESITKNKKVLPRHIQLAPTNKCNLHCSFCSCDDVDKKQELSNEDLDNIVNTSLDLNVKGFTITGGGEPTLHKYINNLIFNISERGMYSGLVSNGKSLNYLNPVGIHNLTWARISFSDEREFNNSFIETMNSLRDNKDLDLAFSYVVTDKLNLDNVSNIVTYANNNNFTHVRLVSDIYNPTEGLMGIIKEHLDINNISDNLVIYQERKDYSPGSKDCYISILKPLIAPDGFIYPCCGVQYALPEEINQKKFPSSMKMGHYTELKDIVENQNIFKGDVCVKCYYKNYNDTLGALTQDITHKEFI